MANLIDRALRCFYRNLAIAVILNDSMNDSGHLDAEAFSVSRELVIDLSRSYFGLGFLSLNGCFQDFRLYVMSSSCSSQRAAVSDITQGQSELGFSTSPVGGVDIFSDNALRQHRETIFNLFVSEPKPARELLHGIDHVLSRRRQGSTIVSLSRFNY